MLAAHDFCESYSTWSVDNWFWYCALIASRQIESTSWTPYSLRRMCTFASGSLSSAFHFYWTIKNWMPSQAFGNSYPSWEWQPWIPFPSLIGLPPSSSSIELSTSNWHSRTALFFVVASYDQSVFEPDWRRQIEDVNDGIVSLVTKSVWFHNQLGCEHSSLFVQRKTSRMSGIFTSGKLWFFASIWKFWNHLLVLLAFWILNLQFWGIVEQWSIWFLAWFLEFVENFDIVAQLLRFDIELRTPLPSNCFESSTQTCAGAFLWWSVALRSRSTQTSCICSSSEWFDLSNHAIRLIRSPSISIM